MRATASVRARSCATALSYAVATLVPCSHSGGKAAEGTGCAKAAATANATRLKTRRAVIFVMTESPYKGQCGRHERENQGTASWVIPRLCTTFLQKSTLKAELCIARLGDRTVALRVQEMGQIVRQG